jgi:beta-glucosidase
MSAIPATDLGLAYAPNKTGFATTLTPTESGDFTFAVEDPTPYSTMTMTVSGAEVLTAAGTPGDQYGTGTVSLQAGQTYQIQISGPSSGLSWATPETRQAAISQAVAAASKAQVAVVVVGDNESEAMDRVGMDLGEDQDALVSAVAAANPNTIVVLNAGSAVLMPWLNQVKAVLDTWYPGEQDGTALAALLFGQVDPSGKLPVTFPASQNQIPASTPQQFPGVNGVADYSEDIDVGYRWYDQNNQTPLFPFGFGLSYTTFSYSDLSISPWLTTAAGDVQVSATVTNTGQTAGSDVAQLYLGDPASTGEPPRQLKGFQKVTLAPRQSTRVTFTLTPSDLSYWNTTSNEFQVDEGTYQVYVGDASDLADLPMSGRFQILGTTGSRATTVQAPAQQVTAGQPMTVTATLSPGGDLPLLGANLRLSVPDGWTVTPEGPTSQLLLLPDQALTATWQVTPPADEPANVDLLTATSSYSTVAALWPQVTQVGRTQVSVIPPTS